MRLLKIFAVAYALAVVLPSLAFVSPFAGMVLLAVGIAVALQTGVLERHGLRARFAVSLRPSPPESPPAIEARAQALSPRLDAERRALADALPADPLASEPFVQVLGAYVSEPDEERQRVEDEYRAVRRRFETWEREVDALRSTGAAAGHDVERLQTELDELQRYVDALRVRAEAARSAVETALEATGRAEAALDRARSAWIGIDSRQGDPELEGELDDSEAKLRTIRGCFVEGAERPMTALRFAREILDAAERVESKAAEAVRLPGEVADGLRRLSRDRDQARRELVRLEDCVQEARAIHAPRACDDLEGMLAAAEHALTGAGSYVAAATRREASDTFAEAAADLAEGRASVERASGLLGVVAGRLERLEDAALHGRARVVEAEKEVDRATAREEGDAPERAEAVRRATELVARAREELERERPDWLGAVELADRSVELVRSLGAGAVAKARHRSSRSLAEARTSAAAARESALAWRLVASGSSEGAVSLLGGVEEAFSRAVALAAAAEAAPSGPERERAISAATEAFEEAERAANDAVADTVGERSRLGSDRVAGSLEIVFRRLHLES